MVTVDNTDVCIVCGEEFWYQFDCRTGEYTKISQCACDRLMNDMVEFLREHGLYEEFQRYHSERKSEV